MEIEAVQELMAACHEAKRITELLPKLPKGMTPRHIGVIDAIHGLTREGDVCVSAVSARLGITRPSVTRLIWSSLVRWANRWTRTINGSFGFL